jgi:deazaflavin-dependent oxidoreductase (nitroreductase family)
VIEAREPRSLRLRRALVNPVVSAVLRSPAHRVLSGSYLLLQYTGRRSGRRRELPVAYARDGERLLVVAGRPQGKRWWRNFRGPHAVEVIVAGERRPGRGRLLVGEAREQALRAYVERFPRGGRALGVHARRHTDVARGAEDAVVVELVFDAEPGGEP